MIAHQTDPPAARPVQWTTPGGLTCTRTRAPDGAQRMDFTPCTPSGERAHPPTQSRPTAAVRSVTQPEKTRCPNARMFLTGDRLPPWPNAPTQDPADAAHACFDPLGFLLPATVVRRQGRRAPQRRYHKSQLRLVTRRGKDGRQTRCVCSIDSAAEMLDQLAGEIQRQGVDLGWHTPTTVGEAASAIAGALGPKRARATLEANTYHAGTREELERDAANEMEARAFIAQRLGAQDRPGRV